MNGIYFFFGTSYSNVRNIATDSLYKVILTVIATNGLPEAVEAGILIVAIDKILFKVKYNYQYSVEHVSLAKQTDIIW